MPDVHVHEKKQKRVCKVRVTPLSIYANLCKPILENKAFDYTYQKK